MVADALHIFGDKQQCRVGADIARVFHHVGQVFAEQAAIEIIDFLVAQPDLHRLVGIAGQRSVQHILQHRQHQLSQALNAGDGGWVGRFRDRGAAPAHVFRMVGDAFQVGGNA